MSIITPSLIVTSTVSLSISTITDKSYISSRNFGGISSIFTPPTTCLSTLTYVGGQTMYFGRLGDNFIDTKCFPYPSSGDYSAAASWNLYYYSPAVACPTGWSTVTRYNGTFGGISNTVLSIGPSTTAALCCPFGYTAGTSLGHQCYSTPLSMTTLSYKSMTTSGAVKDWVVRKVDSTTISANEYVLFGDGIPIWYQESDQISFSATESNTTPTYNPSAFSTTLSSSTQSVATPSSALPIPTSTSSSTDTPSSSPPTSGLSTSAKAGIGIGISVFAIAIGFTAVFFFLRLRKRRANDASWNQMGLGRAYEVDGDGSQIHEVGNNGYLEDQPVFVDRGRG